MYPSKRPPLSISRLSPALVAFPATGQPQIVCPTCRTWQPLRRATGGKVITPHRRTPRDANERREFTLIEITGGTLPRCPDAARLVELDLSPAQWRARLLLTPRDAEARRATHVHPRPTPPIPTPVFRLAS
jgi:hypothetical protein